MYNLIKNNTIQFDRLIIEKYYQLSLDEVDSIILIRLHDLLSRGIRMLSVDDIAASMKIDSKELGQRIVDLVTKGFITLELSAIDAKEVFSLDETYRRLAFLLEVEKEKANNTIINNKIKETVTLLEKELKKILNPLEIEMVSRWYLEEDYLDEEIEEGILKALKYKNRGVNYIDRLLAANRRQNTVSKPSTLKEGENIQDLFKKIYAKSK